MKSHRVLIVLITISSFVFNACSTANGGAHMSLESQTEIRIRTEREPIYNHFPGLPETEHVEWCSTTSDGIGPSTVNLYLFAFLTDAASMEDIINQGSLSDTDAMIDSIFLPEGLKENETWSHLLNVPFCFQEEVPITKRMSTEVYINSNRDIVYDLAIG